MISATEKFATCEPHTSQTEVAMCHHCLTHFHTEKGKASGKNLLLPRDSRVS